MADWGTGPLEWASGVRCAEIAGTVTCEGGLLRVAFTELFPPRVDRELCRQVLAAFADHCRRHYAAVVADGRQFCSYYAVRLDDAEYGVLYALREGRVRFYLFESGGGLPELLRRVDEERGRKERRRVRALLERGITGDATFLLYYQPLVQVDGRGAIRTIKGAEAYLRVWDRGAVRNPRPYLDVAEADKLLMRKLGFKILELACADLKRFKAKYPLFTMSLNVSEQQFARFDDAISFEQIFATVRQQYAVERHDIALEVPELSADANAESAAMLKRLYDDGTTIILDDFTLGALMRNAALEIDQYKISGQTLRDCCHGSERERYLARDFLARVFAAARRYGKSVVVKGVESPDEAAAVLELGFSPEADLMQGNAFCPPLDRDSFELIYQENMTRRFRAELMELLRHATVRVLCQDPDFLIEICSYLRDKGLSGNVAVAQSFSELWATNDRNLVVILDYAFVNHIVTPDQLKDEAGGEAAWRGLLADGSLFEIPGLDMALIDNFQDKGRIADLFKLVEEYDGHNLYQILISINREKTEKIPFIIVSDRDTELRMVEENVLVIDKLASMDQFADSFVASARSNPAALAKFKRL